jgi:hypothetical protein
MYCNREYGAYIWNTYLRPYAIFVICAYIVLIVLDFVNVALMLILSYMINSNHYNMTSGCPLGNGDEVCNTTLLIYTGLGGIRLLEYGLMLSFIEVISSAMTIVIINGFLILYNSRQENYLKGLLDDFPPVDINIDYSGGFESNSGSDFDDTSSNEDYQIDVKM